MIIDIIRTCPNFQELPIIPLRDFGPLGIRNSNPSMPKYLGHNMIGLDHSIETATPLL
jgi:hypothetical protein